MSPTLLQVLEVSLIPLPPLPLLNLALHDGQIAAEDELLAIAKPHAVVGFALPQFHALFGQTRAQFGEGLVEEAGEEEEAWALVEAVRSSIVILAGQHCVVEETAAPAGEGVLFDDGDLEAGVGEAGCCRCSAYACAYHYRRLLPRRLLSSAHCGCRRRGKGEVQVIVVAGWRYIEMELLATRASNMD